MSFIYLASPYSSPNTQIMHYRFAKVTKATAELLRQGNTVFSPIVYGHDLAKNHKLPVDIKFWWKLDKAMLESASALWILTLDGWKSSKGIRREAGHAIKLQLPIEYRSYTSLIGTK